MTKNTKKKHFNWKGGLPSCFDCNVILGDYRSTRCKKHSKLGALNPLWTGDNVKYTQLHNWVRARLMKPKKCAKCKKKQKLDLANRGIYNRELKNWTWLCRRCHMKSDGRLKTFISFTNAGKKGSKNALWKGGLPRCHCCNLEIKNRYAKHCKKHWQICKNKMIKSTQ